MSKQFYPLPSNVELAVHQEENATPLSVRLPLSIHNDMKAIAKENNTNAHALAKTILVLFVEQMRKNGESK